ncbi:hypothetical protein FSP39_021194 [Pinctada imbricata]|uniref:Uncharacterized protein n=1 Tax=Pinctada imbricata TaxID=66713 RepID=A0AA89BP26_PINIB|nr:hypothetical protein FSP39_021194 [Pinctada imbricata]
MGNFEGKLDPIPPVQQTSPPQSTVKEKPTKQPKPVQADPSAETIIFQGKEILKPNVEFIGGFDMLKGLMNDTKPSIQSNPSIVLVNETLSSTTVATTTQTTLKTTTEMPTSTKKVTKPITQGPPPEPIEFKVGDGSKRPIQSVFSLNGKIPKPKPKTISPSLKTKEEKSKKPESVLGGAVKESSYSVISNSPKSPPEVKSVLKQKPVSDFQSASLGGGGGVVSSGVLSGVMKSQFKGFRHKGGVIVASPDKQEPKKEQKPAKANSVIKTQLSGITDTKQKQHITQPKIPMNMQSQMIPPNEVVPTRQIGTQNHMSQLMQQKLMMQNMMEPLEPEMPQNWPMMASQMAQNANSQIMAMSQVEPMEPSGVQQQMPPPQPNAEVGNKWQANKNQNQQMGNGNPQQSTWNYNTQQPQSNWNNQRQGTTASNWNGGNPPSTVSPPPKQQWDVQRPRTQTNPTQGSQWGGNNNRQQNRQNQNARQNNRNAMGITPAVPPSMTLSMMEQFAGGMEMANPFNMGNMGMFPMGEMPQGNPFFFGGV